jgi:hypothetical protein
MKYSINAKLNKVLNHIEDELKGLGIDEVARYRQEFKGVPDYNIAQYGNVTVYYDDVREIYKDYKSFEKASNEKLWDIYRRQVGYVARKLTKAN